MSDTVPRNTEVSPTARTLWFLAAIVALLLAGALFVAIGLGRSWIAEVEAGDGVVSPARIAELKRQVERSRAAHPESIDPAFERSLIGTTLKSMPWREYRRLPAGRRLDAAAEVLRWSALAAALAAFLVAFGVERARWFVLLAALVVIGAFGFGAHTAAVEGARLVNGIVSDFVARREEIGAAVGYRAPFGGRGPLRPEDARRIAVVLFLLSLPWQFGAALAALGVRRPVRPVAGNVGSVRLDAGARP
ncbi:MAG: hypothetical protein R3F20_09360 [Planctomycetota bacterium]